MSDPADRLIGQHLIGMVNEAGYLTGDTAGIADTLGTSVAHVESRPCRHAAVRSGRRFRARPAASASAAAQGAQPLRSGDGERSSTISKLLAKRNYAALRSICGVDRDDLPR